MLRSGLDARTVGHATPVPHLVHSGRGCLGSAKQALSRPRCTHSARRIRHDSGELRGAVRVPVGRIRRGCRECVLAAVGGNVEVERVAGLVRLTAVIVCVEHLGVDLNVDGQVGF
jgi:hypothetical protein